jgi:hypothetical protein
MFARTPPQEAGADHPEYTVEERRAWQWLRLRLQDGHDRWTERELAHLRFARWLAVTGRLVEDGGRAPTGDNIEASTR